MLMLSLKQVFQKGLGISVKLQALLKNKNFSRQSYPVFVLVIIRKNLDSNYSIELLGQEREL
jgi:hypothetical protein